MTAPQPRHFLSLNDLTAVEVMDVIARSVELKAARARGDRVQTLLGKVLGMVFEKASTRTRVSFEVGIFELGGHGVYLAKQGTQIGRGEPVQDTARVLGGYCGGIVIRTFAQQRAEDLARFAGIPVVNGLTDLLHPCQVLADLLTVYELRGRLRESRYAWIGDGNNMAHSWINAAGLLGLDLSLACPAGFEPDAAVLAAAEARMAALGSGSVKVVSSPHEAIANTDVVSTDVWASMGQEDEAAARVEAFQGYCVDEDLMQLANKDAVVLHCLPAHRGEEISAGVIDGPQSAVWRQAENRLHVQKAILELVMGVRVA